MTGISWFLISEGQNRTNLREVEKGQEGISREARDDVMIIPVRCFSCGKVVGHLWEEFNKRVDAGEEKKKVLDDLGLKRYCCRQLFLGHVDLLKEVSQFKP